MDRAVFAFAATATHQDGHFEQPLHTHACSMDRPVFAIAATATHGVRLHQQPLHTTSTIMVLKSAWAVSLLLLTLATNLLAPFSLGVAQNGPWENRPRQQIVGFRYRWMCITDRSAVVQCSELQESRHSQAGLGAFRAYVMDPARAVIQQRRDTRRSNPNMWPKSAVVNENVWRRVLLFSHPGRTHGCLVLPQRSFPSGTVSLARTAGAEMGLNAAELVQNTVVYAPATG